MELMLPAAINVFKLANNESLAKRFAVPSHWHRGIAQSASVPAGVCIKTPPTTVGHDGEGDDPTGQAAGVAEASCPRWPT